MNKNQRLYNLIETRKSNPSSVLFHPILMHFAARFNGKTYSEFASDYRVLVESNVRCLEYFDHDALGVISDPYRETSAFGAEVRFPGDSVPICTDKIVRTMDDVKALKNPDVYKNERTLDRIRGIEYYKQLLGDDVPIIGWIEGPLAEACDLAGVTDVLIKLALEPDFARRLMDTCIITAKDFARAQVEAGCNVMGVGDAICSQISPAMYEDFVFPLHRELFGYIHSLGVLIKLHICGNITHLLPKLKETGADIIDIDWMVDMEKAHDVVGDGVTLCGNLDPVSVVLNLSAAELLEVSRSLISMESGRNFIFSGGCEITVNTPVENLKAMRGAERSL